MKDITVTLTGKEAAAIADMAQIFFKLVMMVNAGELLPDGFHAAVMSILEKLTNEIIKQDSN